MQNQTGFTGGPWEIGETFPAKGNREIEIDAPSWPALAVVYQSPSQIEEGLANARLISAAPELFHALVKLCAAYSRLHDGLSGMVESGRLSAADAPDDYQWLVELLAGECSSANNHAQTIIEKVTK